MTHIFNRTHFVRYILLTAIVFGGFGLFTLSAAAQTLPAQPAPTGLPGTSFDLDGYLWSNTIGWVSLNCRTGGATGNNICGTSNYRVSVDSATGNMTGYAWSSNVGWIRLGGLSGFPTPVGNTAGNAMVSGNYNALTLFGWARACSGTNSAAGTCSSMGNNPMSGAWDGWISLRGATPNYGISTNRTLPNPGGFAWGSTIVGWVSFDLMRLLLPTATLTGTGCTIPVGASSCSTTLNWSFSTLPTVSGRNIQQSGPVTASNIGGAPAPTTGSTVVSLGNGANLFRAFSGTSELSALPLSGICDGPNTFFTPPGICDQLPPTLTITTNKELVRAGEPVTVTWTITPPAGAVTLSPNTICRVYGPGMPSGVQAVPGGSAVSGAIRNRTVFEVKCDGTFSASMGGPVRETTAVEVIPTTQEI
jgi:hypothetical protein